MTGKQLDKRTVMRGDDDKIQVRAGESGPRAVRERESERERGGELCIFEGVKYPKTREESEGLRQDADN